MKYDENARKLFYRIYGFHDICSIVFGDGDYSIDKYDKCLQRFKVNISLRNNAEQRKKWDNKVNERNQHKEWNDDVNLP